MKKILSFLGFTVLLVLVTGGYFIFDRYRKTPEQIMPYPYMFSAEGPSLELTAPILLVGDSMGEYFAKFQAELAETISVNLSHPIKIQSIAKEGHALHRTIHELKSLTKWPQILIYQGGAEEFKEKKFLPSESELIKLNFTRFSDDRISTLLMLYPWLSRIIYEPHKRVILPPEPALVENVSEEDYLAGLETELLLFREQLVELINLSKNKNSLLILTTTPINLDAEPKRVCDFTATVEIKAEILTLKEMMEEDPKAAYTLSTKLAEKYSGNAEIYYLHGQIAKRLGQLDEAKKLLLEASAFDCLPWRATEVSNSIIRAMAQEHQVILFDFALLVDRDWTQNTTFFDDIHPQNLYYQKGMQQLGLVIKDILKL